MSTTQVREYRLGDLDIDDVSIAGVIIKAGTSFTFLINDKPAAILSALATSVDDMIVNIFSTSDIKGYGLSLIKEVRRAIILTGTMLGVKRACAMIDPSIEGNEKWVKTIGMVKLTPPDKGWPVDSQICRYIMEV